MAAWLIGLPVALCAAWAQVGAFYPAVPAKGTTPAQEATEFQQSVTLLASEAMAGRGSGTPEADKARDYLVEQFRAAGLMPAFGKSYAQPFPINMGYRAEQQSLEVRGADGKTALALKAGKDFSALGFSASGSFDAQCAFVGYAITSKQHDYDSFAGAADDVLKGKVAVAFRYEPQTPQGQSRWTAKPGDWTDSSSITTKANLARKHGAIALILVDPLGHRDEPLYTAEQTSFRMAQPIPVLHVTTEAFTKMLAQAGLDAAKEIARYQDQTDRGGQAPAEISNLRLAGRVKLQSAQGTTSNVAGVLPGRGNLANEVVLVGAHYDHLGRAYSARGSSGADRIYPGANDNASGTAGVLVLARRFVARSRPPANGPCRTIIFACFSGEERGLLGSSYMARHLDQLGLKASQTDGPFGIAAMVDIDMIGRLRNDRLDIWGAGSSKDFPSALARAAEGSGLTPVISGGSLGASDHGSFYRIGVPAACISTGMYPDLHRPTDTADKIDAKGAVRVLGVVDRLVEDLATGTQRMTFQQPRSGRGRGRGAFLGVQPDFAGVEGQAGARLGGIVQDGPAMEAKLKEGDLITRWDGKPIAGATDLHAAIQAAKPGATVKLTVHRGERVLEVSVKLGSR